MKDFQHAVVIGRFQPLHNGHVKIIERAAEIAENVIVLVGSARSASSIKNPFSFIQRRKMIEDTFPEYVPLPADQPAHHSTEWTGRMKILPLRDYYYSDSVWVSNVQALTSQFIKEGDSVALLGNYKDESSYYLKMFPQWEFSPPRASDEMLPISGTQIRNKLFHIEEINQKRRSGSPTFKRGQSDAEQKFGPAEISDEYLRGYAYGMKSLPPAKATVDWEGRTLLSPETTTIQDKFFAANTPQAVQEFLAEFRMTAAYTRLVEEWAHVTAYQSSWRNSPHPPVFVTADAVVVCAGHVLVVKRGFNPGKGLYALPGGFVRDGERIQAAAIRELREETRIRVDKLILESSIINSQTFDYPHRSLRGRTITHAFHFRLKDGTLPEVAHGDDAAGVQWMPLMDVSRYEDMFFEDHAHIINAFITRG